MPTSPVTNPLDPVAVNGTLVTVDQYLNNPTVITRTIADYAGQRMFASKIFTTGSTITGSILFERPNELLTDLYAGRRTQEMAPGAEHPILRFDRGVPMVALPRKIGGKFPVYKEARERNSTQLVTNAIIQAGNTLDRDVQTMAMGELNAVIAATGRTTAAGGTWAAAASTTFNTKTAANQPISDLVNVQLLADLDERGVVYNGAIFHPTDMANLTRIYGPEGVGSMLASVGITTYDSTPRQTQGKVKLYAQGQVGVWANEFPLTATTWIEHKTDETFWYAWTISPAFAVTNQFAMIELTGV